MTVLEHFKETHPGVAVDVRLLENDWYRRNGSIDADGVLRWGTDKFVESGQDDEVYCNVCNKDLVLDEELRVEYDV